MMIHPAHESAKHSTIQISYAFLLTIFLIDREFINAQKYAYNVGPSGKICLIILLMRTCHKVRCMFGGLWTALIAVPPNTKICSHNSVKTLSAAGNAINCGFSGFRKGTNLRAAAKSDGG